MYWVPFIKDLHAKGVPVIVNLSKADLEDFVMVMDPKGLFLWVATDNEDEERRNFEAYRKMDIILLSVIMHTYLSKRME
jgi:hypothetical protein